jgi:hypothetical protein
MTFYNPGTILSCYNLIISWKFKESDGSKIFLRSYWPRVHTFTVGAKISLMAVESTVASLYAIILLLIVSYSSYKVFLFQVLGNGTKIH